jgi:hypothetical protein
LVLRQPIDSSQVILDERVMDFHLDDLWEENSFSIGILDRRKSELLLRWWTCI